MCVCGGAGEGFLWGLLVLGVAQQVMQEDFEVAVAKVGCVVVLFGIAGCRCVSGDCVCWCWWQWWYGMSRGLVALHNRSANKHQSGLNKHELC